MKKLSGMLLLVFAMMISGCSSKQVDERHYTYFGENEAWSAEYKLDSEMVFTKEKGRLKAEGSCEAVLAVTYKDELSTLSKVKEINISCDAPSQKMSLSELYEEEEGPSDNVFIIKTRNGGAAAEDTETVIEVNISIDGKGQNLKLYYKE